MERIKFSNLSLLSQKERSAFQIDLSEPRTVLVAGNGYGKSAVLKSLYEALGAKPHKIDKSWIDAKVISLLEFTISGKSFSALKSAEAFTIYDADMNELVSTNRVTAELGPVVSNLFDFRLVLADKKDQIRTPPPSYAFAPYYVDQDRSWQKPWDSFKDLSMFSRSAKSLSEYHSGLRPNGYYEAKAERDLRLVEMSQIHAERRAVDQALFKVRESMPATPISLDIDSFSCDTERLVAEAQILHDEQASYRTELAEINEEYHLWVDHVTIIRSALGEMDEAFVCALDNPSEVECPMCGEHYGNHIADQFELVADKEELAVALQTGRQHLKQLEERRTGQRRKIEGVAAAIERVQEILTIHRKNITLRDVVVAQGRNEAQRVLLERLAILDAEYGEKQRQRDHAEQRMKDADSRSRKEKITLFFSSALAKFNEELDVSLPDGAKPSIQGVNTGRGSAGPRGLAAYYYAFLHTVAKHGSSGFCPIVVDAPNQQGQDQGHLQQIMKFLLTRTPENSQVIIGTEAITDPLDSNVIDITNRKNRVLREDLYERTLERIGPFLRQSVL